NGVDADNVSMHDLGDVAVPAPESISELKVQSSLYDASVPGAGGSSIELITKSGGNSVHGSVYGYFRNEAFNANDPNLKAVGIDRPADGQNVYGATVGGPIRKDRSFYFVSYQGLRATNGATSDSLYSNVMIDPCLTDDRSAVTLQSNCFSSQTVKPAVDPVSLALLNYKLPDGKYLIPRLRTAAWYRARLYPRFTKNSSTQILIFTWDGTMFLPLGLFSLKLLCSAHWEPRLSAPALRFQVSARTSGCQIISFHCVRYIPSAPRW